MLGAVTRRLVAGRGCRSRRGGRRGQQHRGAVAQPVAAFGDDIGDLPAFVAVSQLGTPTHPVGAVRVAAVDQESPSAVAAEADLTVPGAAGSVALLRQLAAAVGEGAAELP